MGHATKSGRNKIVSCPLFYSFLFLLLSFIVGNGSFPPSFSNLTVNLDIVDAGYYGFNETFFSSSSCYLGTYQDSMNLCSYNWAMAAIGGFFLLVVLFMSLCRARVGRPVLFLIFYLLADGVLLALGIVNTIQIHDANNAKTPSDSLNGWRNSILGLSWAAFSISVVGTGVALAEIVKSRQQLIQQPQQFIPQPPIYSQPPPAYYPAPPPGAYPPSAAVYGTPVPQGTGAPSYPGPPQGYPVASYPPDYKL